MNFKKNQSYFMLHDIYSNKEISSRYSLKSFINKSTFIELAEEIQEHNKSMNNEIIITMDDGLAEHYWASNILNELDIKTLIFVPTKPVFENHLIHSHLIQFLATSKSTLEISNYIENYLIKEKTHPNEIKNLKLNKVLNSTWTKEMVFITTSLRYSAATKIAKLLFQNFVSKEEKSNAKNLYMTPEDLKSLSNLSNVVIGGHGSYSDILTETNSLKNEIEESSKMLKKLSTNEKYFAYPNGIYNDAIIKMLKSNGFSKAFTTAYEDKNVIGQKNFKIKRIDIASLINTSNNRIKEIVRTF